MLIKPLVYLLLVSSLYLLFGFSGIFAYDLLSFVLILVLLLPIIIRPLEAWLYKNEL